MSEWARLWLIRWAGRIAVALIVGACAVAVLMLAAGAARAEEQSEVDALILTGVDVSGSMEPQAIAIEIEGIALAIQSPDVLAAIQSGPRGSIGFAVYVWADGDAPLIADWRVIATAEDAAAVAAELLDRLEAVVADQAGAVGNLTNLSGAMEHAGALLGLAPFRGDRQVVNIVGNGADNVGEDPLRIRDELVARGVTINGVVVGGDPKVMAYYRAQVAGGPRGSGFVLSVGDAEGLVYGFRRKFLGDLAMAE